MMNIAVAYFHYLLIMLMMGSLITEHILLKPKMDAERIKSLAITDLIYGISALLVLLTGLLRFFYFDKGTDYYLANPLFHIKLTLFLIAGLISIYPTIHFLRWRKMINIDTSFNPEPRMVKRFTMILRIELFIIALIPLLAVLINRGY
jgi:putative membrane protein